MKMIRRGRWSPRLSTRHRSQGGSRRNLRSAPHQGPDMSIEGDKPPALPIHYGMAHRHGAAQKILEHRNPLPIPEWRDQGLLRQLLPLTIAVRKIQQVNPFVRALAEAIFPPCLGIFKAHAGEKEPAGAFIGKVVQIEKGAEK